MRRAGASGSSARDFVVNHHRVLVLLAAFAAVALVLVPIAGADVADETALADRYSPVVRLVTQEEECGPGEPYIPTNVDTLFDEPTVAFRGPWNRTDLVKIAPVATDLANRYEYHLDFPGDPLEPGCSYELWSRRITEGSTPTVYAHVATDPGFPGKLALQYWLFYPFNDFNNTHEGDWEMIQLDFDAADAGEALAESPVTVGYSSHEGAERAVWGEDEKLEIVGGSHPVVYPGAGSHANKYTQALYLGSSAEAGVGCDDTRGPHDELRPAVEVIPSDADAAKAAFPWIAFEGRWGELEKAFFNGPTGPNMKDQWTHPIEWSQGWRDVSYAVPTGGIVGTGATDVFCSGVARGSKGPQPVAAQPRPDTPPARRTDRPRRARRRQGDVDAGRPAPTRAPPQLGPDPRGERARVRQARAPLRRDRCPAHSHLRGDHAAAVAPPVAARRVRLRGRGRGPAALPSSPSSWGRPSRCSASASCRRRPHARSSRSTQAAQSVRSAPTGLPCGASGRSSAPSRCSSSRGCC